MKYTQSGGGYYFKVYKNGKKKRISKKEYKQRGGDYKLMKGNKKNITINQTHKSWQMIDDALNSAIIYYQTTNNYNKIYIYNKNFKTYKFIPYDLGKNIFILISKNNKWKLIQKSNNKLPVENLQNKKDPRQHMKDIMIEEKYNGKYNIKSNITSNNNNLVIKNIKCLVLTSRNPIKYKTDIFNVLKVNEKTLKLVSKNGDFSVLKNLSDLDDNMCWLNISFEIFKLKDFINYEKFIVPKEFKEMFDNSFSKFLEQ